MDLEEDAPQHGDISSIPLSLTPPPPPLPMLPHSIPPLPPGVGTPVVPPVEIEIKPPVPPHDLNHFQRQQQQQQQQQLHQQQQQQQLHQQQQQQLHQQQQQQHLHQLQQQNYYYPYFHQPYPMPYWPQYGYRQGVGPFPYFPDPNYDPVLIAPAYRHPEENPAPLAAPTELAAPAQPNDDPAQPNDDAAQLNDDAAQPNDAQAELPAPAQLNANGAQPNVTTAQPNAVLIQVENTNNVHQRTRRGRRAGVRRINPYSRDIEDLARYEGRKVIEMLMEMKRMRREDQWRKRRE